MEFSGFLLLFIVMSRFLVCMIIIHKELYAKKKSFKRINIFIILYFVALKDWHPEQLHIICQRAELTSNMPFYMKRFLRD